MGNLYFACILLQLVVVWYFQIHLEAKVSFTVQFGGMLLRHPYTAK